MMHHNNFSIIGFNEDAILCDKPSYDVIPDRAYNLHCGIKRIFPNWNNKENLLDIACVKVDYAPNIGSARSLNIAISEPIEGHIVILAGKMTETPYLIDMLVSYIHHKIDNESISLRPCDIFTSS